MTQTKSTKVEWFIENNFCTLDVSSKDNGIICSVECGYQLSEGLIDPSDEEQANAHLIVSAPDMYAMIESLASELEAAIGEVNTMRDIHHTDNLTPADHWDQESLHDAQVLLAKARGES